MFFARILALLAVCTAHAALKCDLNSITNEIATSVKCSYPPEWTVNQIRTVFYTPTKRSSKFYSNITHARFEANSGNLEFQVVYSLPVREYNVGVAAEVYDPSTEKYEWHTSDQVRVAVRDPPAGIVSLVAATAILGAFIASLSTLLYKVLPPSTRRAIMPSFLAPYLG